MYKNNNMFCHECGKKINTNSKFCEHCGRKIVLKEDVKTSSNVVTKSNAKKNKDDSENGDKLVGFSGWLFWFGLGLFLTPIVLFFSMVADLSSYDQSGIFINVILIIAYIWLIYLMVKRKQIFKKWFFGISIGQVAILSLIALGAHSESYLYTQTELSDMTVSAGRALVYAVAWNMYLKGSVRVKNTLIN